MNLIKQLGGTPINHRKEYYLNDTLGPFDVIIEMLANVTLQYFTQYLGFCIYILYLHFIR